MSVDGLVAVVTGGNSGIGLSMARGLATAGASVAVWARDAARSATAVAELRATGADAEAIACDIGSEDAVAEAVAATVARFGGIDILVANAGTADSGTLAETSLKSWRRVLGTNLDGTFLTVRDVAGQMVRQGRGGAIVIVSSIVASYGAKGQGSYAASKAALISLGMTAAVEYAPHGIRCNVLLPGWTATPMNTHLREDPRLVEATTRRTPVRRWADPDEFQKVITYLADPELAFHTGDRVVVDGGYTIF